jgi:chemotaxis protein methyltransferase CheR
MSASLNFAAEPTQLSPRDFAQVSAMIYRETGIVLADGKKELVRSRLAKRLRVRGIATFAEYVRMLDTDNGERHAAMDALTTNHTAFFRENHHFEHFASAVRPQLIQRATKGERIRMWSSACSSGEEPYSLAMTMLGRERSEGQRLAAQDLLILATDLSPTVVARARARLYPTDTTANVPAPLASAWLRKQGDQSEIDPGCAAIVKFCELNLMGEWPIHGRFDVIFCRNVMIYFDEPTTARLQARLVDRLLPGGYLYIGHSERLIGAAAQTCRPIGQTIYQKDAA